MHPRRSSSLLTLALIAAVPAIAAEKDSETIVVTATRFPDSRFSAPIGVRIITDDEIRYSGASTLAEALNKLGGVQIRQDLYGGSNPSLDLRGFGMTGDQNTLVLVDGVRVSENELAAARLSGISLESVERIEILAGAGGAVLYGSNATGGVINIITKQGRFNSQEARVSVGAGNFGTHDLRASANVSGDQLSLTLNAQDYASENERKNNHVSESNASGTLALRLRDTDLAFNFGSERNRARLPGARSEAQWQSDPRGASTPNDFANTDLWYAGLSATHRIGEIELAANLVRRDRSTEYFFNDLNYGTTSTDHRHVTIDEFSPRIKWNGKLAGLANELIAGYDLRNWDFQSKKHDDFGFGFAGPSLELGKQKTEGWYFQDSLRVSNSTLLSLGARTESLEISRDVPYALTMTPVSQDDKRHLDAWSLGLKQTLIKGLVAHVRTGTSYRIANIDENRCYSAPCELLKPQTSKDHEAGLAWSGGDTVASIVVFRSDLENEIYYNNLLFTNTNLNPTRRQGVELSGSWDPVSNLTLSGRYALTDATFRSGTYSGIDVSGKTVPVVPRHRVTLLASWLATGVDRINVGVNYVGPQQYDNDPANRFDKMPSYTTVDTRYAHTIGDATLALTVKNLFDKKYYSYALVNSSISPTTFNAYPDLSRTIMATFDYKFR
jgi:iron complex outermembrane receptor protein